MNLKSILDEIINEQTTPKDTPNILEKIKKGIELDYSEEKQINIEDLLKTDENNITYLEYFFKNDMYPTFKIQREISSNKKALYIMIKKNYLNKIFLFKNENIFFEKVEENKTIIDLILENNKNSLYNILNCFKNRVEIIDYMKKYKKLNEVYSLSGELIEKIYTEEEGKFLIDKYSNDKEFVINTIEKVPIKTLIKYCHKKGNYNALTYVREEELLTNIEENKTILEFLLEKNITPVFYNYDFENKKTIDILIKYNRWDLLYKANIKLLLSKNDNEDKNYFEKIIEKQNNGQNMHLEKMSNSYYNLSSEIIAKKIMLMAKNNILGYLPSLDADLLLRKEIEDKENVIQLLVKMDKDITISKILPKCRDKNNPNLAIALKSMGIDSQIKIEMQDKQFSDEIISDFNKKYAEGYISKYEDQLNQLREMFYKDGKSNHEYVDAFITSYRYLTSKNNDNAIKELIQIIEIKKNNPDTFILKKVKNGAYFSQSTGSISLDNAIISTINHETTHALHYYLANDEVPENFQEAIKKARKNPNIIEMVSIYSKMFQSKKKEIKSTVSKSKISEYYDKKYTGEKRKELETFLKKSKEEKKKELKETYEEDVLDIILEKTYSTEDFIKQRKELEEIEVVDTIFRNEYAAFIAIGDIIDAIFKGKFKNGILKDNNQKIESAYGHGIEYYANGTHTFSEMIANYGTILKSKNEKEMFILLRKIVGNELVDILREFYTKKIIESQNYNKKEGSNHAR